MKRFAVSFFIGLPLAALSLISCKNDRLPAWEEGNLDIHFINTGRGESSFFILPDGTQMLVDVAGLTKTKHPLVPAKPDSLNTAAYYSRKYIGRCMEWTGNYGIDYLIITHWHTDHFGTYDPNNPVGAGGNYTLAGVTDILDNIPVKTVLDRGCAFPAHMNWATDPAVANYLNCCDYHQTLGGLTREEFRPGHEDQITLKVNPSAYANFSVRNIAANGNVWTGTGTETKYIYIPESEFDTSTKGGPKDKCPGENGFSCVFKLTYGDFDYFGGGDASNNGSGTYDWKIIETDIAHAVGQVEVMKASHHGCTDANGLPLLTSLDPQVMVFNTWNTTQPHLRTMERLPEIPDTDFFLTNLDADLKATFPEAVTERFKSESGHVVIRVSPGGAEYCVYVLDDEDPTESMKIKEVFGPYSCR